MPINEVPLRSMGRKAFTLVELLIVIGIIAVLIAILLPALNGARRHAQEIKCRANLRSLGQGLAMYNNSTGYFPGCYVLNTHVVWAPRLRVFLNGERGSFLCPARDPDRFTWTDELVAGNVAADRGMTKYGYDLGERMLNLTRTPFSYGYNGGVTDGRRPPLSLSGDVTPDASWADRELRVTRVRVPSEMIAIADGQGDGEGDPWILMGREGGARVGTVHRGGANVLFCDGHVEWYRFEDITLPPNPTEDENRRVLPLWRNDHQLSN